MTIKIDNVNISTFMTSKKLMIDVDLANQHVGSHYIKGLIWHIWKKCNDNKLVYYPNFEDFVNSIFKMTIINVDSVYQTGNVENFYQFLQETYETFKDFNIYGSIYHTYND